MVTFVRKTKKSKIPKGATNVIDRTGTTPPPKKPSKIKKKFKVEAPEKTLFPNAPKSVEEADRKLRENQAIIASGQGVGGANVRASTSQLLPQERATVGLPEQPINTIAPAIRRSSRPTDTISISSPVESVSYLNAIDNPNFVGPVQVEQTNWQKFISGIKDQFNDPAFQAALSVTPFSTKKIKAVTNPMRALSTVAARAKLFSGGIKNLLKKWGPVEETLKKVSTKNLQTGRVGEVIINTKTVKLTEKILSKKFAVSVLAAAGGWAGAVFLGQWGQAESTEPLSIIKTKYLIPNALDTGNWSLVREAEEITDELLDLEWWEKAALWSPISPIVGIPNKIEGAIAAATISKKLSRDLEEQQKTGESEDEYWTRRRKEEAEQEIALTDYYNSERKKMFDYEQEAKRLAITETNATNRKIRNEDAEFWRREREKQRELEAADRKAIAEFWTAYRKAAQKAQEDQRPSKLNFGII